MLNLRFNRDTAVVGGEEAGNSLFNFTKNDIMRGVELLVLLITGVLLIFFVLRPLLKTATGGGSAGGAPGQPLLAGAGGVPVTSLQTTIVGGAGPGAMAQLAVAVATPALDLAVLAADAREVLPGGDHARHELSWERYRCGGREEGRRIAGAQLAVGGAPPAQDLGVGPHHAGVATSRGQVAGVEHERCHGSDFLVVAHVFDVAVAQPPVATKPPAANTSSHQ